MFENIYQSKYKGKEIDSVIEKVLSNKFATQESLEQINTNKLDKGAKISELINDGDGNSNFITEKKTSELLKEINSNLTNKVDKVAGKDLSSNDFTDDEKKKLNDLPSKETLEKTLGDMATKEELTDKVDKEKGKELSSNDFTDAEKEKLAKLQNYDDTNVYNEIKKVEENSNSVFSNTLIGEKSGTSVKLDDISPIEHEMDISLSSNTVTDFSNATVTRYGKNIIPYPYKTTGKEQLGVKYTDNGDGTITVSGVATGYSDFMLYEGANLIKNGYITFSAGSGFANMMVNIELYNSSNTMIKNFSYFYYTNSITINLADYPDVAKWRIYIKRAENGQVSGTIYPQIEIGEFATKYEEYVSPITVNADANGEVKGIKALFPTTSLITGNGDVTINCKYNRDINKAFAELQAMILEG